MHFPNLVADLYDLSVPSWGFQSDAYQMVLAIGATASSGTELHSPGMGQAHLKKKRLVQLGAKGDNEWC